MVVSHNVIYITGLGRKVASMYWYFGVMLWPFSVLFFKKKLYETLMSEGFQTVINRYYMFQTEETLACLNKNVWFLRLKGSFWVNVIKVRKHCQSCLHSKHQLMRHQIFLIHAKNLNR